MIRIIAGDYKGFTLKVPAGPTRPTASLVRGAIMSMAGAKIEGARVLDPMAGSGALALEALSRGAASLVLADRSPKALMALKSNVTRLGPRAVNQVKILKASQLKDFSLLAPHGPFDLILLAPPYAEIALPIQFLLKVASVGLAAPEALAIWEQAAKSLAAWSPQDLAPWRVVDSRSWGLRAAAFATLD
ncbi:MAG: RsmD family RNA methyltransferase [Deltaproteobacteria bacterium]|jgi:16S rRNA (guanine966-N2)-methyltransferase|nr:RsmD family RNA methyltransferase [Deltaproteobacteria bacterium]